MSVWVTTCINYRLYQYLKGSDLKTKDLVHRLNLRCPKARKDYRSACVSAEKKWESESWKSLAYGTTTAKRSTCWSATPGFCSIGLREPPPRTSTLVGSGLDRLGMRRVSHSQITTLCAIQACGTLLPVIACHKVLGVSHC